MFLLIIRSTPGSPLPILEQSRGSSWCRLGVAPLKQGMARLLCVGIIPGGGATRPAPSFRLLQILPRVSTVHPLPAVLDIPSSAVV